MLPPSSGTKNKPSSDFYLLRDGFLLVLFFDPEDGGDISSKMFDFYRTAQCYIRR
jgi:hypothetical protein